MIAYWEQCAFVNVQTEFEMTPDKIDAFDELREFVWWNAPQIQVMSGPPTRSAFLKVRIVNIDHYLAEPGSMDNTVSPFSSEPQALLKVPIVRVFGSTPAGQKVCLHIHQVMLN
jgi:hypothetical protein